VFIVRLWIIMRFKFAFLLLPILLFVTACVSTPASVATSTDATQAHVNTAIPKQPATAVPEAVAVPKHKDLLFVEFFGIT
jgi:hypothetical protein